MVFEHVKIFLGFNLISEAISMMEDYKREILLKCGENSPIMFIALTSMHEIYFSLKMHN
jgi:hypothetical protein